MKRFEYRIESDLAAVLTDSPTDSYAIDKSIDLNAFGKEGWELVAIHEHSWYFKREL